jgi:hypothetical protein
MLQRGEECTRSKRYHPYGEAMRFLNFRLRCLCRGSPVITQDIVQIHAEEEQQTYSYDDQIP